MNSDASASRNDGRGAMAAPLQVRSPSANPKAPNARRSDPGRALVRARPNQSPAAVWQVKVILLDVRPAVWRRFWISDRDSVGELHETLQVVMGWQNCHMHEFQLPGLESDGDDDCGMAQKRRERVRLSDLRLRVNACFGYTYEMGDDWRHELVLEKILQRQSPRSQPLPWCLEGANACPPEDSGGPRGHAENLKVLRNARHPDHAHIKEWMGDFHPQRFSALDINATLHPKQKFWLPNTV